MFSHNVSQVFMISNFITILLLVNNHFVRINSESFNRSFAGFSYAVGTWYDTPSEFGSGGACGFANDVAFAPWNGLISAGNNNIFKSGQGCGACYQVKCTENPFCSGYPITITITDECPKACNNEPLHFDLSAKAFGYLAKPGQANNLRKAGRINIQFQRVPCIYNTGITIKIDRGSNAFYLAFAIEYVNGDGNIGSVELFPSSYRGFILMQRSFGATWKADLPRGTRGPYSVKITTIESRRSIFIKNIIPVNWTPGQYYKSQVN